MKHVPLGLSKISTPLLGRLMRACVIVAAGAAFVVACDDQPRAPGATPVTPGQPAPVCEDDDNDGFGLGCSRGIDCDDADPTVTTECACASPNPGCACDTPGLVASCGRVYDKVGSQVICGEGLTTCSDGVWGECMLNGAVTLASLRQKAPPGYQLLALGAPTACDNNPCDPVCTTYPDTPTDLEIDEDSGIVVKPGGVTLEGDAGVPGPPIGGGFGCTGGGYPMNSGKCAHHLCEVGDVLDPSCDRVPEVVSEVIAFSDDFSNGNAKGWTLDPTWAIGPAASSTGHTEGRADPGTDTTATADNNIAGTVLGGNIGGPVILFEEEFANLNRWSESGGTNWNVETLSSSNGYPSGTASGSPAAHSDSCSSGCTLTLRDAVSLSGQSSVNLKLLRFVDEELDNGEYLRLDAFNGSSWNTLFNWSSETYDDDTWRQESFDLPSSYLVSGFRIRFVTQQSSSNEHVHVDDVRLTAAPPNVTRWITSPAFDGTQVTGTLSLSFRRWLNIEAASARTANIEVFNGTTWVNVWKNTSAVSDSSWTSQSLNISAHKHTAMRVRFGWTGAASSVVSGWNLDDLVIKGERRIPGRAGCIDKVCAKDPTCCSTSWHAGCLARIKAECQIDCSRNTNTNQCVACYADPTETVDYDGDGQSRAQGDCLECDARVNSRAIDFKGNAVDENCDGVIDNEPSVCDGALPPGGDAWNHAKAMGLCKVAANANDWGVIDASFVRADGVTPCTDSKQYYILSDFGSGNLPTQGRQMVAYSSGTARDSADPGYIKPNGNGYQVNTTSTPAQSIPAAAGCSSGQAGRDSCGLKLTVRAPSNVQSFSYNFNFFTSEYPEWLCTAYNDAFVAYYYGSQNTSSNKNISLDKKNNPVSVNNGFFEIPSGWPPPSSGSHPLLNGSGFDGQCDNNLAGSKYSSKSICGGATGWLITSAPVLPNEQVTLHYSIWDTGDSKWDSTVLLDNFRWSAAPSSVETGRYEPGESSTEPFLPASFARDYDMSGTCNSSQIPVWSLWSWVASTPKDSRVEFYVTTADTAAGLDTAPEDKLLFSAPASLENQPAIARTGPPDTQIGSSIVSHTFERNDRAPNMKFVRVRSLLVPSTDGLAAPTLRSWNLQTSCIDAQ